ncbi:gluconokinase [Micromonospora sp. WMMD961]|uniref:gluconokinase n=1 Tax=Micromonospora sp. WMMD961 TaxID=3016100 RepID=UPI0024161C75|nr:gluconokinase [Micromonospora sp. WMMD961]MDG4782076.1 gluconokinase [Micromonospora sp. WMMD961]
MTGERRGDARRTRHVVVMGVSGAGKTTVARGISAATGLTFAEADEFHSPENVARMRSGVPLDDTARWPWLSDIAGWIADRGAEGRSTVLACSALKRSYRDVLRQGAPHLDFVHLHGPAEVIRARMARRAGHYMPASLLESQFATLQPAEPDESVLVLDVSLAPQALVAAAVEGLGLPASIPTGER